MLVNYNLNNLSGGISQQQPELRFDNQVEDMVNFTITNSEGLVRRNPTESVIENVTNSFTVDTPMHSYVDGSGNGYGMYLYYNTSTSKVKARVFTTSGVEKTVTDSSYYLSSYFDNLSSNALKRNVQFLTVGDTTWILNKNKTVLKDSYVPTSYSTNKAFYWVKRSFDDGQGKGYDYLVKLKLKTSSTWKTVKVKNIVETQSVDSDGHVTTVSTTTFNIPNATTTLIGANQIANVINGGNQGTGGEDWTGWSAKLVGSVVRITAPSSAEFDFECGDSWGNQASFGWTNEVPKITDLPADMRGFTEYEVGIVAITGSTKNDFTSYYVKWTGESWKESRPRNLQTKIDVSTMPVMLRRKSDGNFEILRMSLLEAIVGDDESNPFPSFIDRKISNMFFFKDRLGFTSEESVCLSETSVYGNFFATTVMEILDSDPIDVTIDSNTVSNIRNITASGGALTLWSDNAQFLLAGGEVLSPATTRISQTSSYSCDNNIPPIVVDNEVIFVNKKGTYSELMSYSPASLQADKSSAESIMAHLPRFITSDIVSLVASPENNMVFILTESEPTTIYVYKYLVQGNQKVMNSFFKWTFNGWTNVKNIVSVGSYLYIAGKGELGEDGSNPSTLKYFVRKIKLEHSENYSNEKNYQDVVNISDSIVGSDYLSSVTLSTQNLKTNQGSSFISEKFRIKTIKVKFENPGSYSFGRDNRKVMNVFVKNKTRNETLIDNDTTGIEDGLYLGIDSDNITIKFSSSTASGYSNKYLNIGTINISGYINHKSKNI
mgnify:CR=1 FL=1